MITMNRRILFIIIGSVLALSATVGGIYWLRSRSVDTPGIPTPTTSKSITTSTALSQDQKDKAATLLEELAKRPVDSDSDGLSDVREAELGTDSKKQDTDGDWLSDGEEIFLKKTDPLKPDSRASVGGPVETLSPSMPATTSTSVPASPDPDSDSDGLTTLQEQQLGTDPNKADTDGDGFNDGDEVKAGYNPLGPGKS